MSVEFLNSNQVYAEVNEAYKQAVGEKAVQTQSIADLISPDAAIAAVVLKRVRYHPTPKHGNPPTQQPYFLSNTPSTPQSCGA